MKQKGKFCSSSSAGNGGGEKFDPSVTIWYISEYLRIE
jgi:hypothetical protein